MRRILPRCLLGCLHALQGGGELTSACRSRLRLRTRTRMGLRLQARTPLRTLRTQRLRRGPLLCPTQ
eukprot:scaffold126921_cov48-Phaeocystis_antarctica.AAC.1